MQVGKTLDIANLVCGDFVAKRLVWINNLYAEGALGHADTAKL